MMGTADDIDLIRGSGNVWRDSGYPDADLRQAKGVLAARIIAILDDRGRSIRKAGQEIGVAAADVSRVRTAAYGRFTLDRMIRMLHALDDDLEVRLDVVPRRPRSQHDAPRP